jgi:hypothetical protein
MKLGSNVNFFLSLQSQIRICHWQTKGHARHTAFGMLYEGLDPLIDEYVEQYMGKYGRFVLDDETSNFKIQNLKDLDVKSFCKNVGQALEQFTSELDPSDTNLLNIRDEMLGLVYKTAYLLTQE